MFSTTQNWKNAKKCRKNAENGQIGVYGLNWNFFLKSELRFEIYDKNYPRKNDFMFLRHVWNFRDLTCRPDSVGSLVMGHKL